MIGSPDLLAFTEPGGFGEGLQEEEEEALPEELSVALVASSHPWTSSAQFHRDFILVAEFSEEVGPKPVLTIPDDPRVIGPFDLNHFAVRLMSVDYQASGPGHSSHACTGPRLNFSEDSKVILGDSAEDAFAYVHHLTLYDLEARGMVRPFCMAYVCSDQAKLMENFLELSTCFAQASESLKTGNRQAFSMELQRKLQELELTRVALLQETEPPSTENGSTEAGDVEAVEHSILVHRDLLRQVTSYPNRKLKQPDFLPYDPADALTDPVASAAPEPGASIFASSSSSCSSEHSLKPLQELCKGYFLSLMKGQLAHTERRLRGDRSAVRTARVSRALVRRLALTNFLFEPWSAENDGEEEERESAEAEQRRIDQSGGGGAPRPQPMLLETFCSCVEEIPIKLEAATLTFDPSVLAEMTGSVSSNDSIEVLGTEKSYRAQRDVDESDCRDTASAQVDTAGRRVPADAGLKRVRAYARRANSEDSIEVLSTTESIFADDLTAITEEEAEHRPRGGGAVEQEGTWAEWEPGLGGQETANAVTLRGDEHETLTENNEARVDEKEPRKQIAASHGIAAKDGPVAECLKRNPGPGDKNAGKPFKLPQAEEALKWSAKPALGLHVNFAHAAAAGPAEAARRSPPRAPLRLLSIDEVSDCASFAGSSDPPSPTQSALGDKQRDRRRRKAGLRALRFLKQNSYSQHALFCLLSGRPLVVVGGDDGSVRKMVDALSLFVPACGPGASAVTPCLSTPLQMTDLLTWRLIGIHRSSSSSSGIVHSLTRYGRYLALLDLDQRTLRCPSYSGSLVGRMADPHTGISRGITYLLHLESCLSALVNRALLYTFNPALQRPNAAEATGFLLSRGFCSSEQDLQVMTFLSDLIKQRHAGRGPPGLRFSYSSAQLHRNTYTA